MPSSLSCIIASLNSLSFSICDKFSLAVCEGKRRRKGGEEKSEKSGEKRWVGRRRGEG
jgi:hypothetical protein